MGKLPRLLSAGLLVAASFLLSLLLPVSANTCISGCHGMRTSKGYQEGHIYTYDFEGTSITSVSEGQGDSTVKLSATVELAVKSDCVHQLTLRNVLINGKSVDLKDVEQYALQFNYHDGHVDTGICAEPNDSQASLNIKRAVISLFQSAVMQDSGATTHREVDVFGNCETNFEFRKEGEKVIVRKHKNLSSCSYRENMRHGLIYSAYDDSSDIKTIPLLDSQQESEQIFKKGILNNGKSTEIYIYRPFANGEASAKTVIQSNLLLKSEKSNDKPSASVSIAKSLVFEAPHQTVESSIEAIINSLKIVKEASDVKGLKDKAGEKFGDFVKVLRKSNKNDILAVYNKLKAGSDGFDRNSDKKILLDALYRTGTGEAAEVIVELIKNKELNDYQKFGYLASLALVDHINLPAVTAVASLLDENDLPRIGFLGIGNVIGKYCRDHNCENVAEIKSALGKILSKIGNGKSLDRKSENNIIAAFKALGNTKYLDDQAIDKIVGITKDSSVNNRVRVAAIEALSAKCSMKWATPILDIFANKEEDSEIRIKAYLSLVSCPCAEVGNRIKDIIDVETVNQVGSFVTTHLRNLRASTEPSKINAKKYFSEIRPRTKFPKDFRKFSFNNEFSYKINSLGVGSTFEQNVIYSQKSFVPRSINLNLTTEIFGRSFNFLEIDTRIENLDRLIEHYFGPKGIIKRSEIAELLINGKKTFADIYNNIKEHIGKTGRGRRAALNHADVDKFVKNIKSNDNDVIDDDFDIDLSLKMFGVELAFMDFKERENNNYDSNAAIDKFFEFIDRALNKAKNFDYSVSNHLHFMDVDVIYPTGLGFPLTLGIQGNGVTHFKSNGKIDVQSIMKDPKNALIKIGFEPSASITISGSLLIDTFGTENGLKVVGHLHTSTGGDLSLKLIDGNGFDINLGIPKRKQEIISISSEVIFVNNNGVKTPAKFSKGKEHSDCFDQFSTILGLTVCGHFSYPYESLESMEKRPLFPISGPAKFSISIENNDVTSYHFRIFYDKSKENYRSLELLFETPKSRNNRKVLLHIEGANKPTQKYIKATFDSPFKHANGQLLLDNTDKRKAVTLSLKHDNDDYFGSVGIVANGNKYKPILEYKIPDHIEKLSGGKGDKGGKATYKLDGDIEVINQEQSKKYVFKKVSLYGSGKKISSLDGTLLSGPRVLAIDANIAHNEESLHIKLDGKRNDNGFDVNLLVLPSRDPNIGFQIIWNYDSKNEEIDHKFLLTYGADLQSKINRLTISDHLSYKKSDRLIHSYIPLSALTAKSEITWPAQEFSVKLETDLSTQKLETEFDFRYGKFKFGTELDVKVDESTPSNWEFALDSHIIDNKLSLSVKQKKMNDIKRKFEGKFEVPGSKYEIEAITIYQIEGFNANIGFDGKLKLNSKQLALKYGLETNPQKLNSHALIIIDNTKYLDFLLKGSRDTNNYNGEFNLYVKKNFITDGQYTYQNGKGAGTINIDLPKFNRKIKGSGDVTITGSRHIANIEILLDAEKDPNKRIKLSTDSDVSKNSLDTKNIIEILSYKIEINGKGKIIEKQKGNFNFEGNFDVTFPNGRYFVGNGKGSVTRKTDETEYHGQYELLDHPKKGEQSRKISYEYELSTSGPRHNNFKAKNQIKLIDFENKDLKFNIDTEYSEASADHNNKKAEIKFSALGTYLPKALQFTFVTNCKTQNEGSWKLDSSFGNDLNIKGTGNYIHGYNEKKPNSADINIMLKLPTDKLRNLKYEGKYSLLMPQENMNEFEYTTVQSITYNDDKKISGDIQMRHSVHNSGHKSEGNGKFSLIVLHHPPLTIGSSFKYDPSEELKKGTGRLNVNYGEKQIAINLDSFYKLDLTHIGMNIEATTPSEKLRNFKIGFERKREDNGPWKYNVHAIADQKKYAMSSEFDVDLNSHRVNVIFTCPEGKTEIYSKMNKLSENEYKGEWKVISPKGFAISDAHILMENIDDFNIEFNFDSDKIKERKIHAGIVSKPGAKAGKRIILTVTSDGKNLITGSTTYSKRDEAGKVIIEGNGSIKIGDNTRSSKFMYSRKQLTRENDGETGVAILLNANFGPSAVVGELKFSDKEVHVFNSFCEQSKDCAHFKLQSVLDTDSKTHMNHQITVEIDLKKFYVPVEFGLKTTTEYHLKKLTFDHTANLYLHTSKDKTQYSSHIYMHSKESAIIFTVPNREFALISAIELPKAENLVGPFKIDISVYLDRKNHPSDKTGLTVSGDINLEKTSMALSGEARFTYPTQTKDMVVKGNLNTGNGHLFDANVDIDIFAKKTQKITINASLLRNSIMDGYNITGLLDVTSRDQQLKLHLKHNLGLSKNLINHQSSFSYSDKSQNLKTLSTEFTANTKLVHLKLEGPNQPIFQLDSKIEFEKNIQKIETEYRIFDDTPLIVSLELRDLKNFIYQTYKQSKPDDKLVVSGRAVIGQVIEFHADSFKAGTKKNLFGIAIYFDESRFLKPNLSYNKENVAHMIDIYRDELIKYFQRLNKMTKEIGDEAEAEFKDFFNHLEKSQPNWQPMIEYYQGELNRLKEEINNDRTLHEIIDAYNKIFGGLTTAVIETLKELVQRLGELHKQLNAILHKVDEVIKATWPNIKESIDKIFKAAVEVMDATTKLSATYLKAIINIINEHQKGLKELATIISEIIHDIMKLVTKGMSQIEGELKNFITLTIQQLKVPPIYEFLKDKWEQISKYQIPEAVLMPIEEAFVQLKKLLPTEELREFLTVIYNYIMKHVKHQKIDEGSEIKNIYTSGVDAVRSIISLLQQGEIKNELYGIFGDNIYKNFGLLKNLPGFPIVKLSIINLIRNGEFPSIGELYYAYRPSAYISDIIPPFSKTGIVVEGGHFFTFDGRHLTAAGTCDYILAHDIRDGNFSIIGSFNNGKFISLTITAPGESITLKSNGNILIDDKPTEYPADTKNLHAFLTLPIVNVKSDYGVHVACSQKAPMICSVHVSGFYHGKLRGIFGDADNEAYDDFTLPTGHITENESEFGNAYRLNSGCPTAPVVDHQHTHTRNPTCTEYFSDTSSMNSCFNYVNPAPFRQACDHASAAGTPRAGCLISAAYYAACRKERVHISIPSTCGTCKVGKEIAIGDSFSVKVPNKQADIIFVIEQDSKNEKVFQELVTPLMIEIRNELKHHGINDVHIGLIGYGDHMEWPQHYTTSGSTNINGEVKNIKFAESENLISFKEAKEGDMKIRLKYAKQRADVELGTFKLTDAYEEAIRYPFRTGAAKTVIGIIASPCEKTPFPLSLQQLRLIMGQKVYRDLGLTYYHIGFLNDILVSGKMQKNIVGYDSTFAYTFSDSKKKPLEGSIDKENLVLTNGDVCAGFAVSSGGAAFSSNDFLEAKPNQRKQFLQVAARRVVGGITNIELEEDCICKQQMGLDGYASCRIIMRNEKDSLVKHNKGISTKG